MSLKIISYQRISARLGGIFLFLLLFSCKKVLEKSPDKTRVIISNLQDCQALLDSYDVMNDMQISRLIIAGDEFYAPYSLWAADNVLSNRNAYLFWDNNTDDVYDLFNYNDYSISYRAVYYTNVVLEALKEIEISNDIETYNYIKGQAQFFRGFTFYTIAQMYCRPYSSTAATDLGISLRLIPDIEESSVRASVQQTYEQIILDLKEAAELLPGRGSIFSSRPNKETAFGALARTYLSMGDYEHAGKYADSCLKGYSALIDYNTVDTNSLTTPFLENYSEVLSYCIAGVTPLINNSFVDTTLYRSYAENDLRKKVFFRQSNGNDYMFKGSYLTSIKNGTQGIWPSFYGIGTDEMYLTRAECSARLGFKDSAMADLNRLLIKRWRSGTFIPFAASNDGDALTQILMERRKELLYRGLRWTDLRRLNLEGANITLTRVLNDVTYTLPPNDLRYVMLLPQELIDLTGMRQNPR